MEKTVVVYRFPSLAALRAAVLADYAAKKPGFEIGDEEGFCIHWEYSVASVDQLSSAGMMSLDNYLNEREEDLCWLRAYPAGEVRAFSVVFCLNTDRAGNADWVAPRHGWVRAELAVVSVFAHDDAGEVTARYAWEHKDQGIAS